MNNFGNSLFRSLQLRERGPHQVLDRPNVAKMTSEGGIGHGVLKIESDNQPTPAFQVSFAKTDDKSHILAVADEAGYVCLFNTQRRLPSALCSDLEANDATIGQWRAHNNAIFDISWLEDDECMLTASGDQTIRLWDVESNLSLATMEGHTGSVKSLSSNPMQRGNFVSGSRDGSIAFWDVRTSNSSNIFRKEAIHPVATVKDAHTTFKGRRTRRVKASSKSITAVLYLKDGCVVASSGDADSVVKFWDMRMLKEAVTETPDTDQTSQEGTGRRRHGIACLSQDISGSLILASCKDNKIYLYSTFMPEKGPLKTFEGHEQDSFYIKACFSPDGTHILSGSSDKNAFIWQVAKPEADAVILKGHEGEVTALDWCPGNFCKIATCSDDYTVRVWSIVDSSFETERRTPTAARHRVSAYPSSTSQQMHLSERTGNEKFMTPPSDILTPEASMRSRSKRTLTFEGLPPLSPAASLSVSTNELPVQKTPEFLKSPSSVLSAPSSLKRKTIHDYFGRNKSARDR